MGAVHLLEGARQVGTVKPMAYVTTDKCYENRKWLRGYRGDQPLGGHDPYSSSKGCSRLVTLRQIWPLFTWMKLANFLGGDTCPDGQHRFLGKFGGADANGVLQTGIK